MHFHMFEPPRVQLWYRLLPLERANRFDPAGHNTEPVRLLRWLPVQTSDIVLRSPGADGPPIKLLLLPIHGRASQGWVPAIAVSERITEENQAPRSWVFLYVQKPNRVPLEGANGGTGVSGGLAQFNRKTGLPV